MLQDTPYPQEHPNRSAEEIFEILAGENASMLTAYLRSVVWRSDVVEDLFQETMIVAWRRLDDFDRTRPFGPWLRGIATRLVLEHRRRSARDLLNCDPAVLEALEKRFTKVAQLRGDGFRERIDHLRECMELLPERMREVIDLGYGRGMLLREISVAVDASTEAIKKRIQRARQALVECLEQSGAEP